MKCKHVQQHIHEYLDDALTADMRSAMHTHLKTCARCQAFFAAEDALTRGIQNTVARKLSGIHFQPQPYRQFQEQIHPALAMQSWRTWGMRLAYTMPLLLLAVCAWLFFKPAAKSAIDPSQRYLAEAYHHYEMLADEMYNNNDPSAPVVVVYRPGEPARMFVLDASTTICQNLD